MAESISTKTIHQEAVNWLVSGNFPALENRFNKGQKDYEQGKINEQILDRLFEVFAKANGQLSAPIQKWVSQYPTSYAANLAAGLHLIAKGSQSRGGHTADKVSEVGWEGMHNAFEQAEHYLIQSFACTKAPILSYTNLITIELAASSTERSAEDWYKAALQIAPRSFYIRERLLFYYRAEWHGDQNFKKMQDFLAMPEQQNIPNAERRELYAHYQAAKAHYYTLFLERPDFGAACYHAAHQLHPNPSFEHGFKYALKKAGFKAPTPPKPEVTTQPTEEVSPGMQLGIIIFGLVLLTIAALMILRPADTWYSSSESARVQFLITLVRLVWNPIGAILVGGFGLLILLSFFIPDKKNSRKPQTAQDLKVREKNRNAVTLLLSSFQIPTLEMVQKLLERIYVENPPKAELIPLQNSTEGKWLARMMIGHEVIRLKLEAIPLTEEQQLETIYMSELDKSMLLQHQAILMLEYERGEEQANLQMRALYTLATALLDLGILGASDQQANHMVSRSTLELLAQNFDLPILHVLTPCSLFQSIHSLPQPNGKTWFYTRGHQRFGIPDLAWLGNSKEQAKSIFEAVFQAAVHFELSCQSGKQLHFSGMEISLSGISDQPKQLQNPINLTLICQVKNAVEPLDLEYTQIQAKIFEPQALTQAEQNWLNQQLANGKDLYRFYYRTDIPDCSEMMGAMDLVGKITSLLENTVSQSPEQRQKYVEPLAALWGHAAVTAFGFRWTRAKPNYWMIHDPDNQLVEHPFAMIQSIINGEQEPLVCSATFNMLSPILRGAYANMKNSFKELN
jgi:hypothetical protein